MNTVSVRLVFDRKHVATKEHQASVQMVVTFNRKRKYFATGIKLYPDQWGKDQRVKNHPQALLFNERLNDMVGSVYEFANQLAKKKAEFTLEALDYHLNGGKTVNTQNSFLHFMRKRINERHVEESTRKRHKCVLRALADFGKIKSFEDITYMNILAWDEYAKKRCNHQSSVYNYHKTLKVYVRKPT